MNYYFIAGHGENDPGATSHVNGSYYIEGELTRDLVKRICDNTGCKHFPFELNAFDHTAELGGLIPVDADAVIEVHFNAFTSNTANGTEVLFAENAKGIPTEKLSKAVAESIGTRNRGVKYTGLKVLSKINALGIPACLLEVCFITSPEDMNKYNGYKTMLSICNALSIPILDKKPPVTHWADEYMEKLKKLGIMTDGRPDDYVKRGELAAVICRTLELIENG